MKKFLKISVFSFVFVFSFIGLFLTLLFIASYFHFTDVLGTVDDSSNVFSTISRKYFNSKVTSTSVLGVNNSVDMDKNEQLQQTISAKLHDYCQLKIISLYAGDNANKIYDEYSKTNSDFVLVNMINAASIRLKSNENFLIDFGKCEDSFDNVYLTKYLSNSSINVFPWAKDEDVWPAFISAIQKDVLIIEKAAKEANIEPRLLISPLFVEQWREYTSNRELFKSVLKPLQTFATSTNFSVGIMNIKQDTARKIEEHLKDTSSPYYLGKQYEHLLDFKTINKDKERFERLASFKDHYYSYLYGALYLAQVQQQWKTLGYPINDRPDVISTLFNIGFSHSQPHANPEVGGSVVEIKGIKYTFGGLAYEFYYSGELTDLFPYSTTGK